MTPRILPLFLAFATCPVAAQSPATCVPPTGITLPALTPIHTAPADPVGGAYGVWAGGRAYKVSFHDGMEFHPRVDDRPAAGTTWKWTTRSVARGGIESAVDGQGVRARYTGLRYEYDFGAVVEAYDVRAEGVEQTFTLRTRPAGRGDLELRGFVTSGLAAPDRGSVHGPLTFRNGDVAIEYGAAFAIDATGARCDVPVRSDGGEIVLRISGDWLDEATFPVVIDPLIANRTVVAATAPLRSVDVVVDLEESDAPAWIVYSFQSSSSDDDLIVARTDREFRTPARTVYADLNRSWKAIEGRIAIVAGADMAVAVFTRDFANGSVRALRWHAHRLDDLTTNTATGIGPGAPGEFSSHPDVGGTSGHSPGGRGLIVFKRDLGGSVDTSTSTIRGAFLDLPGGTADQGTLSSEFPIAATANQDHEAVTVNQVAEGNDNFSWVVAWQERSSSQSGDDWDVRAQRIANTGIPTSIPLDTAHDDLPMHKESPRIEGAYGRYLLAYLATDFDGGVQRLITQRIDWDHQALNGTFPHSFATVTTVGGRDLQLGGLSHDIRSESHWALLVKRASREELSIHHLGFRGRVVTSEVVRSLPGVTITDPGAVTYNDDQDRHNLVFLQRTATSDAMVGNQLEQIRPAPVLSYGVPCGAGRLAWPDHQHVGSEYAGVMVSALPANAPVILLFSTARGAIDLAGIGAPGCTLLVDPAPGRLFGTVAAAASGGLVLLPLPLVEELAAATLRVQAVYFSATGLGATQGVEVELVR